MKLTNRHRPEWPPHVHEIGLDNLDYLGIDAQRNLYFDGARLISATRLAAQERVIAWIVALATVFAAGAAIASAIADWR